MQQSYCSNVWAGAPNFGKTWGDNLFQPEKFQNLGGFAYRAASVSKFGGPFFCGELYRNEGANIDKMYHKSMYDP